MSKPSQEALRNVTTAIAVLASVAGVVLLLTIPDPPCVYALLHIGGCLAVAALAWQRPWLAMLVGAAATGTLVILAVQRELDLPLHGSSAHADYDAWSRSHDPFDAVIGSAMLAFIGVALVALIVRVVRASRTGSEGPEELVAPRG